MLENAILPSRLTLRHIVIELCAVVVVCGLISLLLYIIFIRQIHTFWTYFLITFGYGISIYIASILTQLAKPQWPALVNYVLSLCIGIVLGSVWLILGRYLLGQSIESLSNFTALLLGAAFSFIGTSLFFLRARWAIAANLFQKERLERLEQEKLLAQAQLRTLQSQIEPHFFFNTLATIHSLIDLDQKTAKKMLSALTDLFHLILNRQSSLQDLKLEMEIVQRYLDIQNIRLGERLQYHVVDQANLNPPFPPLLLQPLIENAIKHGIEPSMQGGCLNIVIQEQGSKLVIRIEDDGVGFQMSSSGHGMGIKNIRERLRHLYGEEAELKVFEQESGGVVSQLTVPL